jgi:hypothetical protein
MADPNDAYQRTIDFAAKRYATAVENYRALEKQLSELSVNPVDIQAGGPKESQYAALQKQLTDASKSWQDAENDYQTAIQLQDKARNDAKEYAPAGTTRTRLDTTAGNVLVSVTETADGRGGWSADPNSVKRVQVAGSQATGTRISAPSSDKYIVSMQDDGSLKQQDNPNYQPDKTAAPSAVPTSEFVWNPQTGKVESNPAYRPSNAEINTTAPKINDPNHPGQLIDNPNYRSPTATVSTSAEYIPDPDTPDKFIKNPNYKSPDEQLTTGQRAVDVATGNAAADKVAADLLKAQADAATAQQNLADAQRKARQAPTDQQAQAAIDAAQRAADLANQNLEQQIAQAKSLNPVAAQQAQATLDRTRQSIEQAKLGDQYGLQDRLKQVRDLIASGDITPDDGNNMLGAIQRGTTVYDAMKQAQQDRATARTQDVSSKNALAGNFSSTFNSGFNTIADMNKYAAIGSSAGADAFAALMNMAQDRLSRYELPPAQQTDYLGAGSRVGAMANLASQAAAPAAPSYGGMNIGSGAASNPQPPTATGMQPMPFTGPPAAPQLMPAFTGPPPAMEPMNAGGHTITINIGDVGGSRGLGGEAAGGPPPVAPAPPVQNGGDQLAGAASRGTPATNAEVLSTLFPNAARKFGLV